MDTAPMTEIALTDNKDARRFEMKVEGHTAFIEYIIVNDEKIFLTHTEVPEALGGKGIGKAIVKKALDLVRERQYRLVPLCPFVAAYMKRNPEYNDLLDPTVSLGINVK